MNALRNYAVQQGHENLIAAIDCECIDDLSQEVWDEAIRECDLVSNDAYHLATLGRDPAWVRILNQATAMSDRLNA